jgi:hypothetical protein
MSIQLLNKMEDSFALLYEQLLNENVLRDPMMLLDAFGTEALRKRICQKSRGSYRFMLCKTIPNAI